MDEVTTLICVFLILIGIWDVDKHLKEIRDILKKEKP